MGAVCFAALAAAPADALASCSWSTPPAGGRASPAAARTSSTSSTTRSAPRATSTASSTPTAGSASTTPASPTRRWWTSPPTAAPRCSRCRASASTRTFRGDDRDDLAEEIEDFFEEDGSDVYAGYLAYLRQRTVIASVDGNPDAATALLATGSFGRHALPGPEAYGGNRALSFQLDEGRQGWVGYTGTGGHVDSDGFGGTRFTGTLDGGIDLSDWVGLTGAYTFGYREVEGADLWQSGLEIGVPITLLGRRPRETVENAVSLRLTPVLQFGSAGSDDTGDLGAFVGYGLNAGGGLRIGDLSFTVGAGIVGYSGLEQTFYDYGEEDDDTDGPFLSAIDRDSLDTDLSQALASAGAGVLWRPGTAFSLDAGLAYHRYLDDAAVRGWWAPTAGVALTGERTTVRLGYEGTFADETRELYEGHAVRASFTFSF